LWARTDDGYEPHGMGSKFANSLSVRDIILVLR